MEIMEKILLGENYRFQMKLVQEVESIEPKKNHPKYPILILTCMDPRIDVHRIFQFQLGDVFVLRNAGNIVTEDVRRSILIAIYKYNVKYIIILGHLDCGMTKIDLLELKEQLFQKAQIRIFQIRRFFKPIEDELKNINEQVEALKKLGGVPSNVKIIGMVYDVNTGFVFNNGVINRFTNLREFMKHYKEIVYNKRLEFTNYLVSIEEEFVDIDYTKNQTHLEENFYEKAKDDINTMANEKIKLEINAKITNQEDHKKKNRQIIMPKIFIPKIYFPKIKVLKPKISKKILFLT